MPVGCRETGRTCPPGDSPPVCGGSGPSPFNGTITMTDLEKASPPSAPPSADQPPPTPPSAEPPPLPQPTVPASEPAAPPATPTAPEGPRWHHSKGGQKLGPFTDSQFRQMASAGLVQADDLVWREGTASWVAASSVEGLLPKKSAEPPPLPVKPPPSSEPPPLPVAPPPMPSETIPQLPATATSPKPAKELVAANWHCTCNGEQIGPVSTKDLKGLADCGRLHATDLVWKAGMPKWLPASEVDGLFPVQGEVSNPPGGPSFTTLIGRAKVWTTATLSHALKKWQALPNAQRGYVVGLGAAGLVLLLVVGLLFRSVGRAVISDDKAELKQALAEADKLWDEAERLGNANRSKQDEKVYDQVRGMCEKAADKYMTVIAHPDAATHVRPDLTRAFSRAIEYHAEIGHNPATAKELIVRALDKGVILAVNGWSANRYLEEVRKQHRPARTSGTGGPSGTGVFEAGASVGKGDPYQQGYNTGRILGVSLVQSARASGKPLDKDEVLSNVETLKRQQAALGKINTFSTGSKEYEQFWRGFYDGLKAGLDD